MTFLAWDPYHPKQGHSSDMLELLDEAFYLNNFGFKQG